MILDTMLDRLIDVYNKKEGSNIYKLIKLAADQFEAGESTILTLKNWLDVDQAQGTTLDRIGNDVGQVRGGMEDEEYRQRIKIKIRANLSEGDIETLNSICIVLVGDRFQGIEEGWSLPVDHPIGPQPAMMVFTVKADDKTFGIPIAEIDEISGGGVAANWHLLIDHNVEIRTSYTKSNENSATHRTSVGINTKYTKNSQTYLNAGETTVSANLMNTRGALIND